MKALNIYILLAALLLAASCSDENGKSDAYGNFEAVETIISAETAGKIIEMNIEEGMTIDSGRLVCLIDTSDIVAMMAETRAKKAAIKSRSSQVFTQIAVLNERKEKALNDKKRLEKLFESGAATQQQMDDINSAIEVIEKQIKQVEAQNAPIVSEMKAVDAGMERLNLQLEKCKIVNPMNATVLEKYAELHELAAPGKPLFRIANLTNITLRAYVSGSQLPNIKIGNIVKVLADKNSDENRTYEGTIYWISPEAEFSPKIIQTKEERVNLVYAVKIRVKNDGSLKIGMPGEVEF